MRQRLRAFRQNESGFTLTELLIVIVILGVLAGIVVFSVQFITDRGRTAACETDKKNVEVAVEAYYAQNAGWPTGADSNARFALLVPTFLKSQPSSPDYSIAITDNNGTVTATGC